MRTSPCDLATHIRGEWRRQACRIEPPAGVTPAFVAVLLRGRLARGNDSANAA